MKTWKYIFAALSGLFISFALITSCKKDSNIKTFTMDATIKDAGNIAADGCGWQLLADSTYHPDNLDSQYMVNGIQVSVTFHKTGTRYYCGGVIPAIYLQLGTSEIVIDKITAKQ